MTVSSNYKKSSKEVLSAVLNVSIKWRPKVTKFFIRPFLVHNPRLR